MFIIIQGNWCWKAERHCVDLNNLNHLLLWLFNLNTLYCCSLIQYNFRLSLKFLPIFIYFIEYSSLSLSLAVLFFIILKYILLCLVIFMPAIGKSIMKNAIFSKETKNICCEFLFKSYQTYNKTNKRKTGVFVVACNLIQAYNTQTDTYPF